MVPSTFLYLASVPVRTAYALRLYAFSILSLRAITQEPLSGQPTDTLVSVPLPLYNREIVVGRLGVGVGCEVSVDGMRPSLLSRDAGKNVASRLPVRPNSLINLGCANRCSADCSCLPIQPS